MARVNTTKAFEAWQQGKFFRARGRKGSPIWTDGTAVYSYQKQVAKWSDADGRVAIVNCHRYSVTTSCQVGGLKSLLAANNYTIRKCESEEEFKNTDR